MNFTVKLTEQAENDLRGIYEYIANELKSPEIAINQLDRLEKNILDLDFMPDRFRLYEKEPWYSRGLRIMPVDNYLVFYITDRADMTVTVIRIMYGGRDVDAQLKKNTKI